MRSHVTRALLVSVVGLVACFPALAFHDEGVAHCNGCHTMHNSQDNQSMNFNATGTGAGTPIGTGFTDLLLFQNKSDVCLNCHAGINSYHVWADDVMNPGFEHGAGNFVWLEEDNINDAYSGGSGTCTVLCGPDPVEDVCGSEVECLDPAGDGSIPGGTWTWGAQAIPGTSAGHSMASGIKGTVSDTILTTAPGGTFLSTDLNCASCHDPHGNTGFRMLYQTGQTMQTTGGVFTWNATIDATGINKFFLFGGDPTETNTNHNAYRSGYSEWCSSCHGSFHDASGDLIHPSGEFLDDEQINSYNKYNGTSDCIANPPAGGNPCGSGVFATAYLAMVPFESTSNTSLSSTQGADANSKVACMSCHRSHATSAPDAGRWDFNVTGLAEDGHESNSYAMPNPYDQYQRSLCNKCHSQDEYDALVDYSTP